MSSLLSLAASPFSLLSSLRRQSRPQLHHKHIRGASSLSWCLRFCRLCRRWRPYLRRRCFLHCCPLHCCSCCRLFPFGSFVSVLMGIFHIVISVSVFFIALAFVFAGLAMGVVGNAVICVLVFGFLFGVPKSGSDLTSSVSEKHPQ